MFEPYIDERREYVKERMQDSKDDFLSVINSNLDPQLMERIISCIAYSYFDGHDDAIKIYHDLKLNVQHLNSAMDEVVEYTNELWNDIEDKKIEGW